MRPAVPLQERQQSLVATISVGAIDTVESSGCGWRIVVSSIYVAGH